MIDPSCPEPRALWSNAQKHNSCLPYYTHSIKHTGYDSKQYLGCKHHLTQQQQQQQQHAHSTIITKRRSANSWLFTDALAVCCDLVSYHHYAAAAALAALATAARDGCWRHDSSGRPVKHDGAGKCRCYACAQLTALCFPLIPPLNPSPPATCSPMIPPWRGASGDTARQSRLWRSTPTSSS